MDNRFLLTYGFENMEGMCQKNFKWYLTEEEMMQDIEDMKEYLTDFGVIKAMEILNVRNIELS